MTTGRASTFVPVSSTFVPRSLEELNMERLLDAFPGDELAGRSDKESGPYISPAQIKMILRCPEQYRRRYVKGEKTRPAAALLWGSADHAAHEANFGQKITTHKDLTVADIKTLFAEELDKRVENDGGAAEVEWDKKTPDLTGDDAKRAHADVKDRGVALAAHYHEKVSPAVQPLTVEERFELTVPGVPVKIKGSIDLEAIVPLLAGADELEQRIIDRKTSGRTGVSNEWRLQGRIYQLVKGLPLEFHLSLKTKLPGVVAFDGRFIYEAEPEASTIALVQRAIATVTHWYETLGPDAPWPGAFGGFGDTCGYCGFKPWCAWWNRDYWQPVAA